MASLSSYISACGENPDLKSSYLKLIKLAGSVKTGNLGLHSLIEIFGFLVETSQGAAKTIIDNDYDIWKNKELKSLVDLYFESTTKTLDLFNTVEKCVDKAQRIQLFIRVAIKQFEAESLDTDFGENKKKYARTLEKLNKVKAMEDPFGEEFVTRYNSVYAEQAMLLKKMGEMNVLLKKKHKSVEKWWKLGMYLYTAAMLSIIALALCSSIFSAPVFPLLTTIAIGVTTVIAAVESWLTQMLTGYEEALKTHDGLLLSTVTSTDFNIKSMEIIRKQVEGLTDRMMPILKTAEDAVDMGEDEAVKFAMQDIIKKVDLFTEKIEQVGAHVAECTKTVVALSTRVLKHKANVFKTECVTC